MDSYRWRRDHGPRFNPKSEPKEAAPVRLAPTGRLRWMFTTNGDDPMPQLRFGIHAVKLQQEMSDGSRSKWIDVVVEFPCHTEGGGNG